MGSTGEIFSFLERNRPANQKGGKNDNSYRISAQSTSFIKHTIFIKYLEIGKQLHTTGDICHIIGNVVHFQHSYSYTIL